MGDHIEEKCGVFGIFAPECNVAKTTFEGLCALQHRGQESAGIAVGAHHRIYVHKDAGLVHDVFRASQLVNMRGDVAVGHVRYATSGNDHDVSAAQPLYIRDKHISFALAHNGTLVNAFSTYERLFPLPTPKPHSDTEAAMHIAVHYIRALDDTMAGLTQMMRVIHGAYAMVACTPDALFAMRDPHGIRPLCMGRTPAGEWVVASETCALDRVGATYIRDVAPGELIRFGKDGMASMQAVVPGRRANCIFEYVYFSREDSVLDGERISVARMRAGHTLARESKACGDIVIPVPHSGTCAAKGYAEESGIPLCYALQRSDQVQRTFIQPHQAEREQSVHQKFHVISSEVAGKRCIVVDDSFVRGTTARHIVAMLRASGATQVYLRIASPPMYWPCFYGIATSDQRELLASYTDRANICQRIGADSIEFLSLAGLRQSIHCNHPGFCDACFSGDYVVPLPDVLKRHIHGIHDAGGEHIHEEIKRIEQKQRE